MQELTARQVRITDRFWAPRLEMNARQALDHQWQQLEASRCIDNFRLAAGELEGFREGWFFADSDAYKWLDAACRAYVTHPSAELRERIDGFVRLLERAQDPSGYLFTYNQLHFPGQRWVNLQIEHELYCHGHLIEAAIAHQAAFGDQRMLALAEKAAELLVREFAAAGPEGTPGHEEIELALIRLYRATGRRQYLLLAEQFLERRGRIPGFALHILRQNRSVARRGQYVAEQRRRYLAEHPERAAFRLPPGNAARKGRLSRARFWLNGLSGRTIQQHRPVREQTVPVGHAVRFAYLETALAMLYREIGDETLLEASELAWERMVGRRMYVTGGIGSLPEIEGFGRDFELDPELAYAETCAALGCLFWNWEMGLATGAARYADLFEWQLHNAASVGMGMDGRSYLYNNPLLSRGGIARRPWYAVPCCPSNLSRTWAALGRSLFSTSEGALWVHQYVGCEAVVDVGAPMQIEVESGLPWEGRATLCLTPEHPVELTLHLRIPSWADSYRVTVNGKPVQGGAGVEAETPAGPDRRQTASGYAPHDAFYLPVTRLWTPGDAVAVELDMPVTIRRPHPRVKSCRGRAALTRGPLVYCLESTDNAGLDLFAAQIDPASLRAEQSAAHWDGTGIIQGRTTGGQEFTAIPYFAWANRGESLMTVMVGAGGAVRGGRWQIAGGR